DPMRAALVRELAVYPAAFDGGDDFLEPTDARWMALQELHTPPLTLRILAIHAEQIGREQGRLLPSCPGADLQDDVFLIVGVGGELEGLQGIGQLVLLLG